jgi:uncharacterized protein
LPIFSPSEFHLFARIAVSIVLEAAPFLLIGSFLSVVVERYATAERLARWVPSGRPAQIAAGLFGGMALPICECGVVPVARRLIEKGVPPRTVLTYMLAAPVINPVVLISTYVAFGNDLGMVAARAAVVGITAAAVGGLLGRGDPIALLNSHLLPAGCLSPEPCAHPGHHHEKAGPGGSGRWAALELLRRSAAEFMAMGKYLIAGAVAAAAFKVFLPWQTIQFFAGNLATAVAMLMALAVLLSVCSEADAFVAAAFVYFPPAAQLAFIAVGPMVDLKLIGMYLFTFKRRPAVFLITAPIVCVYLLSILISPLLR